MRPGIYRNTKNNGVIRMLYFQEGDTFIGVCLEFNIIEEGKSLEEVKQNLETACELHLRTVREKRLSDNLLNRHAPKEYWDLYDLIEQRKQRKRTASLKTRRRKAIRTMASPYYKDESNYASY